MSKRLPAVVRLRIRYGTGASGARNAALSGGLRSTAGQEYQLDADRGLGTGPLEAPAHTGAYRSPWGAPRGLGMFADVSAGPATYAD